MVVAFVEGCADGGRSCGRVPIRLVVVVDLWRFRCSLFI